ncbi:hypothetical protein H6G89_14660 [Oscillatoria sp. FACHB-1407]|uniref:hypothetical protein n=1 Tax=Oscillatoria sp. FACHB-1407 TaxID=2692847 RepID=UPI001684E04A|nr:hypothetical protein [Oscillatoria sp. FACHB-1407]MBD2462287.1 hypothetical protein [Oscillatoria sp. FACHB-1407]
MTYFDRFDVVAAYHHFAFLTLYRGMHYDYERVSRLQFAIAARLELVLRYKPGLSDSRLRTISPNAKAIYTGLVRKHLGVSGDKPCKV